MSSADEDPDNLIIVSVLACMWVVLTCVLPFVRTALLARRRAGQGRPLSMGRQVASYGLSFLLTVCFSGLVYLASMLALLIYLFFFSNINFGGGPSLPSPQWHIWLALLLVWGPSLSIAFFFIRWRFRRDVRR